MKFQRIHLAIGIAISGLIASNVYLFSELNMLRNEFATKKAVSVIADSIVSSEQHARTLKDYFTAQLMANPETIVRSLAKYRFEQEQLKQQEKSNTINTLSDSLYLDNADPVMGNPNGKHVIVEFVDYNCVYCKRLSPVLEDFLAKNPEGKVIIKEYPIFNNKPTSAYAALMGTALFYENKAKYALFHQALMATPQLTKEAIDTTIVGLGVDLKSLEKHTTKARKQVAKNRALGAQLEVTGTPTMFINGQKMHGVSSADQLIALFGH